MSMRTDDHRKQWHKEEYAKKAKKRKQEETEDKEEAKYNKNQEPTVQRELLKPHGKKFNFEYQVETSPIVTQGTDENDGYFCEVCDIIVKNSITNLNHVNGRRHQKNLGMSMKIERSSLETVEKRFELAKIKREKLQREYDMTERLKNLRQDGEKCKEYKIEMRKNKKRKTEIVDEIDEETQEISKLMGFDEFNTSRKK